MATRRFDERPRTRRPGAGRPRRQERQGQGPVDAEILGAAARLFSRQGVAATTMAEIADAVGLGVSSIYYYFANKHQLLERIVVDVNDAPLAIAELATATFDDAPRRLHAFIRNDAAALCEFPFDINEIHRLASEDRSMFRRYWTDRQQLLANVETYIADGVSQGSFIDVDPSLTALTVLANDEAVQNWYRPAASASEALRTPDEIGVFVADLALRGLLVDPTLLETIRNDTHGFAESVRSASGT